MAHEAGAELPAASPLRRHSDVIVSFYGASSIPRQKNDHVSMVLNRLIVLTLDLFSLRVASCIIPPFPIDDMIAETRATCRSVEVLICASAIFSSASRGLGGLFV